MRDDDIETNKYQNLVVHYFEGGYAELLFEELWKAIKNSPLNENMPALLKDKTLKQVECILKINNNLNAIGLFMIFNGFYYYAFEEPYDVSESYCDLAPQSFEELNALLDLYMYSTKDIKFRDSFYNEAIEQINEYQEPDSKISSISELDDYKLFYETMEDEIEEIISSFAVDKAYECLRCLRKAFGADVLFCLFFALRADVKEYLYGEEDDYLEEHVKDKEDDEEYDRVSQEYLDLEVTIDKIKEDYEDIWQRMPNTFALMDAWEFLQGEKGFEDSYYYS